MCSDQTKDSDSLAVHICQNINRWPFLTVTRHFTTTLASERAILASNTNPRGKRGLLDSTFKIQTVAYLMLNWIHSAMTDSIIIVTQFITQLISLKRLKPVKRLVRWPEHIWSTVSAELLLRSEHGTTNNHECLRPIRVDWQMSSSLWNKCDKKCCIMK